MTKNTGGPAFPCDRIQAGNHVVCSDGMSLRDYFAAKAMQAIVSTVPHLASINPNHAAIESYEYADAMLKAREA